MATLRLTTLWINLAGTGTGFAAPSTARAFTSGVSGDVRAYAGGRVRLFTQEAVTGALDVTLVKLTLDQVETLESWRGQTVLVRDHRGQRWWGAFTAVDRIEHKGTTWYNAGITVRLVSVTEEV